MGKRNVYCPVCEKNGRKKLLFQTEDDTTGKIIIRCRGCKEDVEIGLSNIKASVKGIPDSIKNIPRAMSRE